MDRPYDLIVYGATGYLGSLVVQYLCTQGPPALRWAVAGRSATKLEALVHSLQESYPQRMPPPVIVATLTRDDLGRMASQTRVVLNTVGPFCKYGTPVVTACIDHSTAYVDSSGEHIWMQQLAAKWHEQAMLRKAIIIPHCAVESSPPDLMAMLLARKLQRPSGPVFFTIEHTWTGYSGGTIASILASLETYSIPQMMAASAPGATCVPDVGPHRPHPPPLLPVRRDRFLGNLTFNPSAMADQAVVMRTWSLLQRYGSHSERYGEQFSFQGYAVSGSLVKAWLSFLIMSVAVLFTLLFPPLRWILRRLAPEPGTGPQLAPGAKDFVEWKATIAADDGDMREPSAMGVMRMNTDVYSSCAVFVGEAALTLLEDLGSGPNGEDSLVRRLGGGILTPASLGMRYLERLQMAGLEWRVIDVGNKDI